MKDDGYGWLSVCTCIVLITLMLTIFANAVVSKHHVQRMASLGCTQQPYFEKGLTSPYWVWTCGERREHVNKD
jgi:hypothetical protein